MTIISYLIFYNLSFLYGRSFLILISRLFKKDIKDVKIAAINISSFSPLIFLFILGNLSFIFNFIFPIKYLIYILIPIIFINLLDLDFKSLTKNKLINLIVIPSFIGISSSDVGLHFDAGLYHLNFQNWLRESNMVLGLSNIYAPYGWSSINEYFSSVFWFNNNFIILHFINLIFVTQFFSFLFNNLLTKNLIFRYSSFFILIYGVIDNFGFNGGRNGFLSIQSIGKFDTSFAILYFIFSILILKLLIDKTFEPNDIVFISLFLLFCIQMKLTGLVCGVLYIFYFYKYKKNKKVTYTEIIKLNIFPFVLTFVWGLKNLLQTGCFLFGFELTCFNNLRWYEKGYANSLMLDTQTFNQAYTFGENLFDWLNQWYVKEGNQPFLLNFLLSIVLLTIGKYIFYKKKSFEKSIFNFYYFYIVLSLIIWITGAPDPRFAYGIFLLFVGLLGADISGEKNFINRLLKKEVILYLVFFVCLAFTPRLNSYEAGINSLGSFRTVTIPKVEYKISEYWGEIPIKEECWINLKCNKANKNLIESKLLFYSIFEQ